MPPYRYQQAPWDFECNYRHCCPHLQGLSTKWVFDEYQRSHDEHLQHWKVRDIQQEELEKALEYIGKLEKENEELNAKLKALHQRQFKANKKISENSADNRLASEKKKKRGAPKGHPGWHRRKPDHIDKTDFRDAPNIISFYFI
jgi:hypothetical protein